MVAGCTKTPVARRAEHSHATTTLTCAGVQSSSAAADDVELTAPVRGNGTQRPRRRRSTVMAYRRSRHSYNPIMHVGVVQRPLWTYAGNTSDPVRFQNFSSPHCHAVRPRRDGSDLPRDALASSLRPRRLNASARVVSSSSDVEFDAATAVNLRRRRRRARRSVRLRLRPRPCRNG